MRTVLYEGIKQAVGQLLANKLRSILSLLGITIGIFCIISVQSAVDSLEENIKDSFRKLGTDVLYLSKMPWNEDPFQNQMSMCLIQCKCLAEQEKMQGAG